MAFITRDDLAAFATIDVAKADALIADAEALARRAAPCLADPDVTLNDDQLAVVKAVLRAAILRRNATGDAGEVTSQTMTAGAFSRTESVQARGSRGLFWPTELDELRAVCAEVTQRVAGRAGGVDMVGAWLPWWYDPTDVQRPEGYPVNPEILTEAPSISSPMG